MEQTAGQSKPCLFHLRSSLSLGLVFAPVGRPTIRAVDAGSRALSRRDTWRPEPLAAPATSTWARNTCAPVGSSDSIRRPWISLAQDVLIRGPPLFRSQFTRLPPRGRQGRPSVRSPNG